jgi:CBS domain-containing protein
MARSVAEIMNTELFSVCPEDSVQNALNYILALGISGAPVIDPWGRPVGMISVCDLVRPQGGSQVRSRMSVPVAILEQKDSIEQAARYLGEKLLHRAPVVDEEGIAVGIVSALDLVQALVGLPVVHPSSFPHYDRETGLSWSDDVVLDEEHAARAAPGPGILVLRAGGTGVPETDIWVEPVQDVRARVDDLLGLPQDDRGLARLLEAYHGRLRFRSAWVPNLAKRRHLAEMLRGKLSPALHSSALT